MANTNIEYLFPDSGVIQWSVFVVAILMMLMVSWLSFVRGKRSRTNTYFLLLSASIILWAIANFMENETWLPDHLNIFFLKLDFSIASFLAYFLFLFGLEFYKSIEMIKKTAHVTIFLIATLFSLLSFTDLIIREVFLTEGAVRFTAGSFFNVYAFFVAGFVTFGIIFLILASRSHEYSKKIQARYILVGFLIAGTTALTVNLLLYNTLPTWAARIGIYSIFFISATTAYSISRLQLFNLRIATAEILTSALVLFSFSQIFLARSILELIFRVLFFAIVSFFGFSLIRSISREHKISNEVISLNADLSRKNIKLKKMAQDLRRVNDHLRELMESKTEFLHVASHQLRTPLTNLRGLWDLSQDKRQNLSLAQRADISMRINSSVNQLNNIVNDLLEAMNLEGGALNFKFENINVFDLVEDASKVLSLKYKEKGLDLVLTKPPKKIPFIRGDREYLKQVFINLLDNAEKYTPKGKVTVTISLTEKSLNIIFEDTGIGVSPEEKDKLFEKFYRGNRSTNVHADGSGLGLFIVKKIISAHGGSVNVKSAGINKGAAFTVQLPYRKR